MPLHKTARFRLELQKVLVNIAKDKKTAAKQFNQELEKVLISLLSHPFRCRQSYSLQDERVRDLVFRGYTLPYLVASDSIIILGIYNSNEWEA